MNNPQTTQLSEKVEAMIKIWREWKGNAPGLRETPKSFLVNAFWAAIDAGDKDARYGKME